MGPIRPTHNRTQAVRQTEASQLLDNASQVSPPRLGMTRHMACSVKALMTQSSATVKETPLVILISSSNVVAKT